MSVTGLLLPEIMQPISRVTFSIIYALFAMPYAVNALLANTIEAVRVEMNRDEAE